MPQDCITESLMLLLRCAVFSQALPRDFSLSEQACCAVRSIAQKHDLLHLVEYAAKSDSDSRGFGSEAMDHAIFSYLQQETVLQNLRAVLEEEQLPFVLLKGAVLRTYYPDGWMRTCSDIDVLVPLQEYPHAIAALLQNGFIKKAEAPHDTLLISREGVKVEIHHLLILPQESAKGSEVLKGIWSVAQPIAEEKAEYRLPEAYFYLYHIAHMAKHFRDGGCGIRPFIDLFLLMQRAEFDRSDCHELLAQCDLKCFAENAEKLANAWFGDGPADGLETFAAYILSGGSFGTVENAAISWQKQSGSRSRYLLSRFFPLSEKENPAVQKHPYLLPFMWSKRWVRLIKSSKRKAAWHELRASQETDSDYISAVRSMMDELFPATNMKGHL